MLGKRTYRKEGKPFQGGVAQLGEHLPCKQGVMGSIPIISTSSGIKSGIVERRYEGSERRHLGLRFNRKGQMEANQTPRKANGL